MSCPRRSPPPCTARWTSARDRPRPTATPGRSGRSAPRRLAAMTPARGTTAAHPSRRNSAVLAPLNSLLPDPADPDAEGATDRRRRGGGGTDHRGTPACAAHRARRCLPRRAAGPHRRLPAPGSARRRRWPVRHPLTRRELPRTGGTPRASRTPRGDCRCPVVDRPPPTTRYAPTAAQRRWVAPVTKGAATPVAATRPAGWISTTSSRTPRAGPPTATTCAAPCRRHHRLKTYLSGWSFHPRRRRRTAGHDPAPASPGSADHRAVTSWNRSS